MTLIRKQENFANFKQHSSENYAGTNQAYYFNSSNDNTLVMAIAPFFRFDRYEDRTDNRWSCVGRRRTV